MDKADVILSDRPFVDLYGIRAVLLHIGLGNHVGRELALLAHEHEACAQTYCQVRSQQETPGFKAHNLCDAFVLICLVKPVREFFQAFWIKKEGCDVLEHYPFLRKVRDYPDIGNQFFGGHTRILTSY